MSLQHSLESAISCFPLKKICVLGDLMVDGYVAGNVSRISPEAPVVVLDCKEKWNKAGGAANVAMNVRALGAACMLGGVVSDDAPGKWLRDYLEENSINTDGIVVEEKATIVKTRFVSGGQQILRVDDENISCISADSQDAIYAWLEHNVQELDALIFSDYAKAVLLDACFVQKIISLCAGNNVFVAVDTKSTDLRGFRNADVIKPNNLELENAVGIEIVDSETLDMAGKLYLEKSGAKNLVVTRGDKGISVFCAGRKRQDFGSKASQVFDVTGAGDSVICAFTLAVCSGCDFYEAAQLANFAAGVVISKFGTATVSALELLERIRIG